MNKLPLLSLVFMLALLPLLAASDHNPRRGLQRALLGFLAYNLFFVLLAKLVILP